MKAYWWQGGVHIEPESDADRDTLVTFVNFLNVVRVEHQIPGGPIVAIKTGNEQPIIEVDKRDKGGNDKNGASVM